MASARKAHYTLTFTGSVQSLLPPGTTDYRLRGFALTHDPGNANPFVKGGLNLAGGTLSASDYGSKVPAPTGGVVPPPLVEDGFADGTILLSDVLVLGEPGEKLHVDVTVYI